MREKIMIVFQRNDTGEVMDLEIPTNISITELIFGLNIGLNLGIDMNNPAKCFLRSENPIALLNHPYWQRGKAPAAHCHAAHPSGRRRSPGREQVSLYRSPICRSRRSCVCQDH